MPRPTVLLFALLAGCFGEPPRTGDDTSEATQNITSEDTTGDPTSTSSEPTGTSTDPTTSLSTDASSETSELSSSGSSGAPIESYCSSIIDEHDLVLACRDFDERGGEIGTWHDEMIDGGVLEVAAQPDAPSPPNALHTYFPVAAGEFPSAAIRTALGKLTSPHRLRFRMELGACDGEVLLVNHVFGGPEPFEVGLVMVAGSVQLRVVMMGTPIDHALDPEVLGAAPPWPEWELEVDVLGSSIAVRVEQMVAIQLRGVLLPLTAEPPSVRIGVLTGGLEVGCAVRYDDIAVVL
jgi:hypothetical protein